MAQNITVKPEYVNKVQAFVDGKTVLLNNLLTQAQLLAIYLKQEFRPFFDITYSNVQDSFPEDFPIDPSLFNAYDSNQITHNPAGVFGVGTVGKALVETKAKIDGFDGAFVSPTTAPSFQMNFAGGKFWNPRIPFSRNSIGTYIDQNGVMRTAAANKPRFTHDPITKESLGLLMEEARTNLATYSNDFSNVSHTKARVTLQNVASVLDPDLTTATKLVEDTSVTNTHQLTKGDCAVVAGQTYTGSIFLKAAERSVCIIQLSSSGAYGGVNPSVMVDLGLGTLSNSNNNLISKIENWGNGWFRVSVTASVVSNGVSGINVQLCQGQTPTYTGDGTSGAYLFGLQFEQGLNASSYIPTLAATVTRATDLILISGALFFEMFPNITEGTIFISAKKADARAVANYKSYVKFGAFAGSISITDHDTQGKVYNEIYANGQSQFAGTNFNVDFSTYFQLAFAFATNDAKSYMNGLAGLVDNVVVIPQITSLQIGGDMNTIIKSVAIWPRRMTDAGMQNITSFLAIVGKNPSQLPSVAHLGRAAFVSPESIALGLNRQEFPLYGTGASMSVNIRRNYDFGFKILDSSGVTSITAQPSADCTADTDNTLTFIAPIGKTLVYEISPKF